MDLRKFLQKRKAIESVMF